MGPYEVLLSDKNDVSVNHLHRQIHETVHVSELKPFFGSREDGLRAARIDFDQYEISRILAYRGCPLRRSTFSVLVLFTDGDEVWKPFDSELSNTVHFERFVAAHPDLEPLLNPAAEFEKFRKAHIILNPVDPAIYSYGRDIYVDIRAWIGTDCPGWYPNTGLPDLHRLTYRVLATFNGKFKQIRQILHFELPVPIFGQTLLVDSYWIHCYGQYEALDPTNVYLDPLMALDYPGLFDANTIEKDRRRLRRMIVPAAGDAPPPRYPTPLLEEPTTLGLRPPTRHLDPFGDPYKLTPPARDENPPT